MAAVIPISQASNWAKSQNLPPIRRPNGESRSREYLTPDEIESMIAAARHAGGRTSERDALLIMLGFRHGLRASEIVSLRWQQIDLKAGTLHVNRLKNGAPSIHPLRGPELRALRAWRRAQDGSESTPYVFTSLREGPMTRRTVDFVVAEAGKAAGLEFRAHAHMLRHACGYFLANRGMDTRSIAAYLGHKSLTNTARYTEMSPNRFRDFFTD